MTYGDFATLCHEADMPICNLFPPAITPTCELKAVGGVSNIVHIVMNFMSLIILVLMILRIYKKRAAVGRVEMIYLFIFFVIERMLYWLITSSLISKDSVHLINLSSFQLAWFFTMLVVLIYNGVVGFQVWRDGSKLSIIWLSLICMGLIGGLTSFNIMKATNYLLHNTTKSEEHLIDVTLYTIYLLVPCLLVFAYILLQFLLVIRSLSARLPLIYLILSGFFIIIGKAIYFTSSTTLCQISKGLMDGATFDTMFLTFACLAVYKYWNDITEDDWDDFKMVA